MYKLTLAAIGATSLFALPAFAATSTPSSQMNGNAAPMSPANLQKTQQKITQDLRNDGYQDIRIVPDSFLVHAKNKQGDAVVMIINPDSVFSVTQMPGSQANAGTPNGSGSTASGLGNAPGKTTKQ